MKNIIAINIILFILSGCGNLGGGEFTSANPVVPNNLTSVNLSYKFAYDTTFNNTNSFWYIIEIENNADTSLDNVKMKINHTWWGKLKDIKVYAGFLKGYKPFGETSFPAKTKMQFIFNADTQNNLEFIDTRGRQMNEMTIFRDIRIHTSQGVGTWRFPKP